MRNWNSIKGILKDSVDSKAKIHGLEVHRRNKRKINEQRLSNNQTRPSQ